MAKRFYKVVTVVPAGVDYAVHLDGRELKTPGKHALHVPSQALAELVAAEWDAQLDEINPASMPVTRLVNVATEQTPNNRDALITEARNYAGSDLLCYRAPAPKDLTERQAERWTPWLDWAERRGIKLDITEGITAIPQTERSLNAVSDYAALLDDLYLTLFVHFTAVFGSAVLAMAVMERALPAEEAFELSRLDEVFQTELWGDDEEAAANRSALRAETIALAAILTAT